MGPLKILVVEDEFIIASNLKLMLDDLGYEPLQPAGTRSEALRMLKEQEVDLAILDINLNGKQEGIEVGRFIREELRIPFIYLTSNADKATIDEAKATQPSAYLIKPFTSEDIYAAIETAVSHSGNDFADEETLSILADCFFIKLGSKYFKVDIKDISYFEADGKMMNIHTIQHQKFLIRTSLESLYAQLRGFGFVRVHRSFCVNPRHLAFINSEIVMVDEREIPLGRNFRDDLLARVKTLS